LQYEEFAGCLAWWNDRQEGPQAWKVRAADLIQRDEQGGVTAVNLDQKNPHAKEAIDHRPPAEIVESIIARERQVLAVLDEIRVLVTQGVAA
jgi:type I restriction enzyme M protein